MDVQKWDVPITATWQKSNTLVDLLYDEQGVEIALLEEETQLRWVLQFPDPAGFKLLCGDHAQWSMEQIPADGGFFEITDSPWLAALGMTETNEYDIARHYIICCQNELIEIAASKYTINTQ